MTTHIQHGERVRPVRAQPDAYNARDIEAFMACWTGDCRHFAFPGALLVSGAEAVRARHVARSREPGLYGDLISRAVVGDVVVDREIATRRFPDKPGAVDALARYETRDGKIASAEVTMGQPILYPPETPLLRRATAAAAWVVRALTREACVKWVRVIGREPRPMTADHARAVRTHRIDMFRIEGAPVALIEMILEDDRLLIENIAVSPAFQRQLLGRRLLAHAGRTAAALGYPVIRLYANPLFDGNVRLYQQNGYRIDRAEAFAGGVTVHMSKPVPVAGGQ